MMKKMTTPPAKIPQPVGQRQLNRATMPKFPAPPKVTVAKLPKNLIARPKGY